jgi:hypothetical protein
MAFNPTKGRYYRMPVFFGPTPGPREWPPGLQCDFDLTPKRRVIGTRFLTSAAQLEAFLPARFSLWGDPIVTVEVQYMTEFAWLAGRGYNMADVKFEAVYKGAGVPVHGTLVLVRFENLPDPILSGREELGHNKLYCEMPEPRVLDGVYTCDFSWLQFPFMKLSVWNLAQGPSPPPRPEHRGMLSYKYIPRTGEWGTADVEYATLTPPAPTGSTLRRLQGEGRAEFVHARWEDLPTLHHVVNAFHRLEVKQWLGGYLADQVGGHSAAATIRLD